MFKGLSNIASMINQAKTMGPKIEELQKKMMEERVTGTSGGGMVTVHVTGLGHVISIEFDETLTESNDLEMAKDLLPAAINSAVAKAQQLHAEAMKELTGDLPISGGGMEDMMKQILGGGDK